MTTAGNNDVTAQSVPMTTGVTGSSAGLTPTDYFVLSRIDGRVDVRTLAQVAGLPIGEVTAVVVRLVEAGWVRLAGGGKASGTSTAGAAAPAPSKASAAGATTTAAPKPAPAPPSKSGPSAAAKPWSPPVAATPPLGRPVAAPGGPGGATAPTGPSTSRANVSAPTGTRSDSIAKPDGAPRPEPASEVQPVRLGLEVVPRGWPTPIERFPFDPELLAKGGELTDEQRRAVLYVHHHLQRVTYYALLGVPAKADREEVKRAYFRMSKAFHPDRWFRRDIGVMAEMLSDIFKWLSRAYGVLSSDRKRLGYDRLLERGFVGEWQLEQPVVRGGTEQRVSKLAKPVPQMPASAAPAASAAPRLQVSESPAPAVTPGHAEPVAGNRSVTLLRTRARRAEETGQWAEAVDLYERVLAFEPSTELRIRLIECMLKASRAPNDLDREIRAALAVEAGHTELLLLDAEIAVRLGQFDRARDDFEAVLSREPGHPGARVGLDRLGSRGATT